MLTTQPHEFADDGWTFQRNSASSSIASSTELANAAARAAAAIRNGIWPEHEAWERQVYAKPPTLLLGATTGIMQGMAKGAQARRAASLAIGASRMSVGRALALVAGDLAVKTGHKAYQVGARVKGAVGRSMKGFWRAKGLGGKTDFLRQGLGVVARNTYDTLAYPIRAASNSFVKRVGVRRMAKLKRIKEKAWKALTEDETLYDKLFNRKVRMGADGKILPKELVFAKQHVGFKNARTLGKIADMIATGDLTDKGVAIFRSMYDGPDAFAAQMASAGWDFMSYDLSPRASRGRKSSAQRQQEENQKNLLEYGHSISKNYNSDFWDAVRADEGNEGEIDNRVLGYCHDQRQSPLDNAPFPEYHGWMTKEKTAAAAEKMKEAMGQEYNKYMYRKQTGQTGGGLWTDEEQPPERWRKGTQPRGTTSSWKAGNTPFNDLTCPAGMVKTCERASFPTKGSSARRAHEDMGFVGNVSGRDAAQQCADACLIKKRNNNDITGFMLPAVSDGFARYNFLYEKKGKGECSVGNNNKQLKMFKGDVDNSGFTSGISFNYEMGGEEPIPTDCGIDTLTETECLGYFIENADSSKATAEATAAEAIEGQKTIEDVQLYAGKSHSSASAPSGCHILEEDGKKKVYWNMYPSVKPAQKVLQTDFYKDYYTSSLSSECKNKEVGCTNYGDDDKWDDLTWLAAWDCKAENCKSGATVTLGLGCYCKPLNKEECDGEGGNWSAPECLDDGPWPTYDDGRWLSASDCDKKQCKSNEIHKRGNGCFCGPKGLGTGYDDNTWLADWDCKAELCKSNKIVRRGAGCYCGKTTTNPCGTDGKSCLCKKRDTSEQEERCAYACRTFLQNSGRRSSQDITKANCKAYAKFRELPTFEVTSSLLPPQCVLLTDDDGESKVMWNSSTDKKPQCNSEQQCVLNYEKDFKPNGFKLTQNGECVCEAKASKTCGITYDSKSNYTHYDFTNVFGGTGKCSFGPSVVGYDDNDNDPNPGTTFKDKRQNCHDKCLHTPKMAGFSMDSSTGSTGNCVCETGEGDDCGKPCHCTGSSGSGGSGSYWLRDGFVDTVDKGTCQTYATSVTLGTVDTITDEFTPKGCVQLTDEYTAEKRIVYNESAKSKTPCMENMKCVAGTATDASTFEEDEKCFCSKSKDQCMTQSTCGTRKAYGYCGDAGTMKERTAGTTEDNDIHKKSKCPEHEMVRACKTNGECLCTKPKDECTNWVPDAAWISDESYDCSFQRLWYEGELITKTGGAGHALGSLLGGTFMGAISGEELIVGKLVEGIENENAKTAASTAAAITSVGLGFTKLGNPMAAVTMGIGAIRGVVDWFRDKPWEAKSSTDAQQRLPRNRMEEGVWKQMCQKDPASPIQNWGGRPASMCKWNDVVKFRSPVYKKAFDGECSDGSEILMFTGNAADGRDGNTEGTQNEKLDRCAEACLSRKVPHGSGDWSAIAEVKGFIMNADGRCFCETIASNACTKNPVGLQRVDDAAGGAKDPVDLGGGAWADGTAWTIAANCVPASCESNKVVWIGGTCYCGSQEHNGWDDGTWLAGLDCDKKNCKSDKIHYRGSGCFCGSDDKFEGGWPAGTWLADWDCKKDMCADKVIHYKGSDCFCGREKTWTEGGGEYIRYDFIKEFASYKQNDTTLPHSNVKEAGIRNNAWFNLQNVDGYCDMGLTSNQRFEPDDYTFETMSNLFKTAERGQEVFFSDNCPDKCVAKGCSDVVDARGICRSEITTEIDHLKKAMENANCPPQCPPRSEAEAAAATAEEAAATAKADAATEKLNSCEAKKSLLVKRMDDDYGGEWTTGLTFDCGSQTTVNMSECPRVFVDDGWYQYTGDEVNETCPEYAGPKDTSSWGGNSNLFAVCQPVCETRDACTAAEIAAQCSHAFNASVCKSTRDLEDVGEMKKQCANKGFLVKNNNNNNICRGGWYHLPHADKLKYEANEDFDEKLEVGQNNFDLEWEGEVCNYTDETEIYFQLESKTNGESSVTVNRETIISSKPNEQFVGSDWQHIPKNRCVPFKAAMKNTQHFTNMTVSVKTKEAESWSSLGVCGPQNKEICMKPKWRPIELFSDGGEGACRDINNKYPAWGIIKGSKKEAEDMCVREPACRAVWNDGEVWHAYCTEKTGICDRDGNGGDATDLYGLESYHPNRTATTPEGKNACWKKIMGPPKKQATKPLLIKRAGDQKGWVWTEDLRFNCDGDYVNPGHFRHGIQVGQTGWYQFHDSTDSSCQPFIKSGGTSYEVCQPTCADVTACTEKEVKRQCPTHVHFDNSGMATNGCRDNTRVPTAPQAAGAGTTHECEPLANHYTVWHNMSEEMAKGTCASDDNCHAIFPVHSSIGLECQPEKHETYRRTNKVVLECEDYVNTDSRDWKVYSKPTLTGSTTGSMTGSMAGPMAVNVLFPWDSKTVRLGDIGFGKSMNLSTKERSILKTNFIHETEFAQYKWNKAKKTCAGKNLKLCSYSDICPYGENGKPVGYGDGGEGAAWVPTNGPNSNEWTHVGKNVLSVCKKETPADHDASFKVFCCDKPPELVVTKRTNAQGHPLSPDTYDPTCIGRSENSFELNKHGKAIYGKCKRLDHHVIGDWNKWNGIEGDEYSIHKDVKIPYEFITDMEDYHQFRCVPGVGRGCDDYNNVNYVNENNPNDRYDPAFINCRKRGCLMGWTPIYFKHKEPGVCWTKSQTV